jgi:hypothetical protein
VEVLVIDTEGVPGTVAVVVEELAEAPSPARLTALIVTVIAVPFPRPVRENGEAGASVQVDPPFVEY